jgi:hypothetical protein
LLVVGLSDYELNAMPGVVSDSKGNSWTNLTITAAGDGNSRCWIAYAQNPVVGSGHTFTFGLSGVPNYGSICVVAFSNAAGFDRENGTVYPMGATARPGNVTPSEGGELLVTAISYMQTNTMSVDSGFTTSNQVQFSGGARFGVALAYKIQTEANVENPQWSLSATSSGACRIATFKTG